MYEIAFPIITLLIIVPVVLFIISAIALLVENYFGKKDSLTIKISITHVVDMILMIIVIAIMKGIILESMIFFLAIICLIGLVVNQYFLKEFIIKRQNNSE